MEEIKKFLEKYNYNFVEIEDCDIEPIRECIVNGIFKENQNNMVNHYYGVYCRCIGDHENMIKYYNLANNIYSLINLAYYYENLNDAENTKIYYDLASTTPNADDRIMTSLGLYYKSINNTEKMFKFYFAAIEKGNSDAMHNLGLHYKSINNTEEMLKYYLMSIEKGNSEAMNALGFYYQSIDNTEEMLKYFFMGVEKENSNAMNNLGYYYQQKNDIENMLKYYHLAITKENIFAYNNLGHYYYRCFLITPTPDIIDNMIMYFSKSIQLGNKVAMTNLAEYYREIKDIDNMIKYYIMADSLNIFDYLKKNPIHVIKLDSVFIKKHIKETLEIMILYIDQYNFTLEILNMLSDIEITDINHTYLKFIKKLIHEKIDLIDLHFNYVPNGNGCIEAKHDFYHRLLSNI